MPPKATSNGDSKGGKMYSADVVAAVLAATGTISLSMKHYELMSSLDGVKTASAFQHDFRAVLARSKELKARLDSGEAFQSVKPSYKRGTCCCVLSCGPLHLHFRAVAAARSHLLHPSRQLQSLATERVSQLLDTTLYLFLCTLILNTSDTFVALHLAVFSQHDQEYRLSCWRSEDDPSRLCLCPAHGAWLHQHLSRAAEHDVRSRWYSYCKQFRASISVNLSQSQRTQEARR